MRMMMVVATSIVLTFAGTAAAQNDVLVAEDFEQDDGGFIAIDDESTVWVNTEAGVPYGGNGCLQVDYFQRAWLPERSMLGLPGTVALPLEAPLPSLSGVSFALWSQVSAPVMVMLTEGDDGPCYNRMVWCEAAQWHEIEMSLEEFCFDHDGPPDPDGQLSSELITGVGFVDAGGYVRHIAEQTPMIYMAPPTQQALRLDDVKLLSTSPVQPAGPAGGVLINDYAWPLHGVAILGGDKVTISPGETDDGGTAMKIDYELPAGTLMGVVHQVLPGSLEGVTHLTIRLWTAGPMAAFINVEEKRDEGEANKSSYQAFEQLPGGDRWQEISVAISDLTLSQDSSDPDGALDLELVEMIVIGDATGMMGGKRVTNTLWLDEFTAGK